ncbi:MAG: hypothetical protein AB7G87_03765 [Clostridia bacterium]
MGGKFNYFLLIFCLVLVLAGCANNDSAKRIDLADDPNSIETIYKEQLDTKHSEEIEKTKKEMSKKVLENMKTNSKSSINTVMDAAKKSRNIQIDTDRSATEMIDDATSSIWHMAWVAIFNFLLSCQQVAAPATVGVLLVSIALAFFFRNDRPKLKFFVILIIVTPILFLIVVYGPAFFWGMIKN